MTNFKVAIFSLWLSWLLVLGFLSWLPFKPSFKRIECLRRCVSSEPQNVLIIEERVGFTGNAICFICHQITQAMKNVKCSYVRNTFWVSNLVLLWGLLQWSLRMHNELNYSLPNNITSYLCLCKFGAVSWAPKMPTFSTCSVWLMVNPYHTWSLTSRT